MTFPTTPDPTAEYRIKIGQRFHRIGYTAVIWQAMSVYRDAQGLEHATLMDEAGRLDKKTLSASVLLDRSQYRLIRAARGGGSRHPERETLELAAAGAAKVLGHDHSVTRALARASITMAKADIWNARLGLKTLRRDQRQAIAKVGKAETAPR